MQGRDRLRKQLGDAKNEIRKLKIRLTEQLDGPSVGTAVKMSKLRTRPMSDAGYDSLTAKI